MHHLAASSLAKVGEAELARMSAERAMSAAEQSDGPLSLASAARAGTHALLAFGRFDEAANLGETAARWLSRQVRDDDPAALSIVGMLYLRTAVAQPAGKTPPPPPISFPKRPAPPSVSVTTASVGAPALVAPTCSCTGVQPISTRATSCTSSPRPAGRHRRFAGWAERCPSHRSRSRLQLGRPHR